MKDTQQSRYRTAGLLWAWWTGDLLPALPRLPGFFVRNPTDDDEVARITNLRKEKVYALRQNGTTPYLAVFDGVVGYGWSARTRSEFGSPAIEFSIPANARYLRDFYTNPDKRGLGIYPHLLQAIIAQESKEASQFWIIHQASNISSARGIAKAGFKVAATICFLSTGGLGIVPIEPVDRSLAGAKLLDLPIVNDFDQPV